MLVVKESTGVGIEVVASLLFSIKLLVGAWETRDCLLELAPILKYGLGMKASDLLP
jgi:hypothetical protein